MMNAERMERVMRASRYQKKAIRALLPESAEGHLDVIEKELKAMLTEMLLENISPEMIMNLMKTMRTSEDDEDVEEEEVTEEKVKADKQKKTKKSSSTHKSVKKVSIS